MNSGKIFENNFRKSIDNGKIYFYRLRDNAASFGQDSGFTRFTSSNDYDCFCFYKGHFFPLELKNTKNGSFSIQKNKKEKSKMIKLHQIEGLERASKYEGCYAGFLLNFQKGEIETTYWLDIKSFLEFFNTNPKKSINENDVLKLKHIKVENIKKKVNYSYEVLELLNNIIYNYK